MPPFGFFTNLQIPPLSYKLLDTCFNMMRHKDSTQIYNSNSHQLFNTFFNKACQIMPPYGFFTNLQMPSSSYKLQVHILVHTTPRIPPGNLLLYTMAKKICSHGPSRRRRVSNRQTRMAPYEVIDLTESPVRIIPRSPPIYDADNEGSMVSSSDSVIKLSPKFIRSPSGSEEVPQTPPVNLDSPANPPTPPSNPASQTNNQNQPPTPLRNLTSPNSNGPNPPENSTFQANINIPPASSIDPFFELLLYPNDVPILSNLATHEFFSQDPYHSFYPPYPYPSTIPPFKGAASFEPDPVFLEQKRFALSQLEQARNRDEWDQIMQNLPHQYPNPPFPNPLFDPCIEISSELSVNSPLDANQGHP